MPQPAWEDLDAFFSSDDFAVSAMIVIDGQNAGEILGIFEDPTARVTAGEYTLEEGAPSFVIKEIDAGAIHHKSALRIEGKLWDVLGEPVLDGTGLATLRLAKPEVSWGG